MKKSILIFVSFISVVFFNACSPDENYAIETNSWGKLTLTITPSSGNTEEWYFPTIASSGFASLKGIDDYPYTYQKVNNTKSTLSINIGVWVKYEMEWTSATQGNYDKYEDNVKKGSGTFKIQKD